MQSDPICLCEDALVLRAFNEKQKKLVLSLLGDKFTLNSDELSIMEWAESSNGDLSLLTPVQADLLREILDGDDLIPKKIAAIRRKPTNDGIDFLLEMSRNGNECDRYDAFHALNVISSDIDVDNIEEINKRGSKDENYLVRVECLEGLSVDLDNKTFDTFCQSSLNDSDPLVRSTANLGATLIIHDYLDRL